MNILVIRTSSSMMSQNWCKKSWWMKAALIILQILSIPSIVFNPNIVTSQKICTLLIYVNWSNRCPSPTFSLSPNFDWALARYFVWVSETQNASATLNLIAKQDTERFFVFYYFSLSQVRHHLPETVGTLSIYRDLRANDMPHCYRKHATSAHL